MKLQMLIIIVKFHRISMRIGPSESLCRVDNGSGIEKSVGLQKQNDETSNAYNYNQILSDFNENWTMLILMMRR